jgi:hypothetical protein
MIRSSRPRRPAERRVLAVGIVLAVGLVACGGPADGGGTPAAAPEAQAPEAETPETQTPESQTPEGETPEAETPADTTAVPGDCSAAGAAITSRPADGLPAEVVALRDLLLDAALRCDEQLLRTAIDESELFTYSFGESGDAIGAWWDLEAAGAQPFLRLAQVLGTTPALADGGEVYVWPQVTTGRPEATTDAAWAELTWLDDPATTAADSGGYLDHRVGVSTDGQWRFFVAGD